jgi:hypothetical protein
MATNFKTLQINGKPIRVKKYGFGWAVFSGPYEGSGSFPRLADLKAKLLSTVSCN